MKSTLDEYFFEVADDVAYVAILLYGGSEDPLQLKCFGIFSADGGNARVWPGYVEGIAGSNRMLAPPLAGERGQIAFNDDPDPGEPVGWMCVQGGQSGAVWKSIGLIPN